MKDYSFLNHFISEHIYLIDPDNSSLVDPPASELYLVATPLPLPEKDKEFLYKIFAAVNVSPDLLAFQGTDPAFKDAYTKVFFFGTKPAAIETVELYKVVTFQNRQVIIAHSLSEIAEDNAKKRRLWSVLKTCFP